MLSCCWGCRNHEEKQATDLYVVRGSRFGLLPSPTKVVFRTYIPYLSSHLCKIFKESPPDSRLRWPEVVSQTVVIRSTFPFGPPWSPQRSRKDPSLQMETWEFHSCSLQMGKVALSPCLHGLRRQCPGVVLGFGSGLLLVPLLTLFLPSYSRHRPTRHSPRDVCILLTRKESKLEFYGLPLLLSCVLCKVTHRDVCRVN